MHKEAAKIRFKTQVLHCLIMVLSYMVYKRLSYHLNRNSVLHKQYYIHIHRILYAFPTGKFCKTLRATRHKSPMSSCSQGKVTQLLCGTRVLATWPKRHRIQSVRNDSLSWSVKTSKASCHVQGPEELSANARKTSCLGLIAAHCQLKNP